MGTRRRNHYDVTDRVRISHPDTVRDAVCMLLRQRFGDADLEVLREGFSIFTQLYAGTLPGYLGCDTLYHDAQHSLDCTLAMARLLDGHDRSVPAAQRLGPRRAALGILVALFHDAGYIRHHGDRARNGAEYTLTHVHRSGAFLASILPDLGFSAQETRLAARVVHFTGYEIALDDIRVSHPKDRMIGFLLGTADVLAQTSDRCYLEKCRDFLFVEFERCGLAGTGTPDAIYRSAQELLVKTPAFNRQLWAERLDGYFGGVYRYLDAHFGGRNPYAEAIDAHLQRLARLTRTRRLFELRQRPVAINAMRLRRIVGIAPAGSRRLEPGLRARRRRA